MGLVFVCIVGEYLLVNIPEHMYGRGECLSIPTSGQPHDASHVSPVPVATPVVHLNYQQCLQSTN